MSISTKSDVASRYASSISSSASAIGSGADSPDSGATNLTASKNCDKCYAKKDSMRTNYAGIISKDAGNITKIDASIAAVDRHIKAQLSARR